MCSAVNEVTGMTAVHTSRKLVHFPVAKEHDRVMHEFYRIEYFAGLTGCIDCIYVRIKDPGSKPAEVFRNWKGVLPMDVQVSRIHIYECNMCMLCDLHVKEHQREINLVQMKVEALVVLFSAFCVHIRRVGRTRV